MFHDKHIDKCYEIPSCLWVTIMKQNWKWEAALFTQAKTPRLEGLETRDLITPLSV